MMYVLAILLVVQQVLALPGLENRVVGGKTADYGDFPYQASVQNATGHVCGGAIINAYHVLTAARCVGIGETIIRVGAPSLQAPQQSHDIHTSYPHPGFNRTSLKNDIAVLRLATPIGFTKFVRPIPLVSFDMDLAANFSKKEVPAFVAGWGTLGENGPFPSTLQYLETRITEHYFCFWVMRNAKYEVRRKNICAFLNAREGICLGDVGSPLAVNGSLVGVASWTDHCGNANPDVFTRVGPYIDWISVVAGI